jgi:hypothetical protein
MIVMGAFAGFAASSLLHHQPTEVVPQYVVLSPPDDCSSGCAVTGVTEVPPRYYEDLPGKWEYATRVGCHALGHLSEEPVL